MTKEEFNKGKLKIKEEIMSFFMHTENYVSNCVPFLNNINLIMTRSDIIAALQEIFEYVYSKSNNDVISLITNKSDEKEIKEKINLEVEKYLIKDYTLDENKAMIKTTSNYSDYPGYSNKPGLDLDGTYSQRDLLKFISDGGLIKIHNFANSGGPYYATVDATVTFPEKTK